MHPYLLITFAKNNITDLYNMLKLKKLTGKKTIKKIKKK